MTRRTKTKLPLVLTIAGHDPSSGAGITADIKTIAAHGCYGLSCITALTVQSARGVARVVPVDGKTITETLARLFDDVEISAVKIGMLGSVAAAQAVAMFLKRYKPRRVVLDPIIRSSSGAELISKAGFKLMKGEILRQVTVITPNIDEAAALSGMRVTNLSETKAAALRLHEMGAANVVITGGHLDSPSDLMSADGTQTVLKGRKISSRSTHGTGCAFSTALACELALGRNLLEAAKAAKRFVEDAMRKAPAIGKGIGPVV